MQLFERMPERLHRNDPFFVPPYPGSITKMFKADSPYQRHGSLTPFIAYKEGQPVGRICAVVNQAHNDYYKDNFGFFGFFDFTNDVEVAKALLDAAEKCLKEQGRTQMRGPYNPTVNDEVGLLVEGFDSIPKVMMPYNPPYYIDVYEKLGLQPARTLFAFRIEREDEAPARILKICERVKRTTGLTLRRINMKKLDDEILIIHKLYNQTLDRNWGFVPITLEDLRYAANDLKAILDPSLVLIAEKDGVPAGFSMCIPNINEFMFAARKWPNALRPLKFLWKLFTSRPTEARLAVLGVAPEFRGKGVAALFYAETMLTGGKRYKSGELSWVEENNEEIVKGITVMGGEKYKTYRLFEKPQLPA